MHEATINKMEAAAWPRWRPKLLKSELRVWLLKYPSQLYQPALRLHPLLSQPPPTTAVPLLCLEEALQWTLEAEQPTFSQPGLVTSPRGESWGCRGPTRQRCITQSSETLV
ncbi:hypothetical protein NDU88_002957 [Pleurodeles waltl]|uniref:Uncharacterized protein n=1 Tax=Pleurodeles waltl TaxID=8319 RepID=A0AAV7NF78_PLEWA|nr:hypothetical protein NDU88_002957 [Pleurodeles waltl]